MFSPEFDVTVRVVLLYPSNQLKRFYSLSNELKIAALTNFLLARQTDLKDELQLVFDPKSMTVKTPGRLNKEKVTCEFRKRFDF